MKIAKQILYMLSSREQNRAFLLLILNFMMSLIEMIGIASIMPFMAVLTNPEIIETNFIVQKLFHFSNVFGLESNNEFIIFLGALVFTLLFVTLSFKTLMIFLQARFTSMCQYNFARRLVERYLNQQYSWFLNRHSADLSKTILSEVSTVVQKGLGSLMTLVARIFVVISVFSMLIFVNPKISFVVSISLLITYGTIYKLIRNLVKRIGQERLTANSWLFKAVSEAFGAAKEIKVGGLENVYAARFSKPAMILAKHNALSAIISRIPRLFIEIIVFGGILLVGMYLVYKGGTFNEAIPFLAVYAFAGYRMIPSLQDIYNSLTQLRFASPSIEAMAEEFENLKKPNLLKNNNILKFNKNINLKGIYYNYPNSSNKVLNNININIPANQIVGFVGSTGSGKTTTVDIILGLLEPQKGTLEVDGQEINRSNVRIWQRSIGYVPQHIYLADSTVTNNIAFGVDTNKIDHRKVKIASKVACLDDFIEELPFKYETFIGERGVRLSGGQRQRIGIARAIYNDPKLLILDEATSALDIATERKVMNQIHSVTENITIIIIAHRLTTLFKSDKIYLFEKGKIKSQGSYKELEKFNDYFKSIK